MAVKIRFDSNYNAIQPTFVLAKRGGTKLGTIPVQDVVFSDAMNACAELSFKVYKEIDGVAYELWDELKDFKLVYCVEWDYWFEIYVEIDETNDLIKNVEAKSLGEAELSQINLYNIEINTEDDIARDAYVVTTLYNPDETEGSLLHRITEKIPHYTIKHVDTSLKDLQRTFTFDGVSIYDAFQEISDELDCLFVIGSGSDDDGLPERTISVYDLLSFCYDCGNRDDFDGTCNSCGGDNTVRGYGEDTTIYVCTDNLADEIVYSTDVDSVKNCFRLEAGDDLMTATITNCNPNGTSYIWYISDETKTDMSDELVERLESYDELYAYYNNEYEADISSDGLAKYNIVAKKYAAYSSDYPTISSPITGYAALMQAYYNTIDFYLYLHDSLMPSVETSDTDAETEAAKLTASALSPVAVSDISVASASTVKSAVLAMAKVVVDYRYNVTVNTSSYSESTHLWKGTFRVENYSDEDDYAISSVISVTIDDDYETFVEQKLEKILNQSTEDYSDIVALFGLDLDEFAECLATYGLVPLQELYDCCQSCIDILIEQGIADGEGSWADIYEDLYLPYYYKLQALESEIAVREAEIEVITGVYDDEGYLVTSGLQTEIESERDVIQSELDFQAYMGDTLWKEFASYRREDTYSNSNFISDGLDNAAIFANALEFIEVAQKEIYKSAALQHSITAKLRNLLVMKEFESLVDYFEIGNWIRIRIDDNLYRLRLLEYEIDFSNLEDISITFSDVKNVSTGVSDVESVLASAASISTSYDTTMKQSTLGSKGYSIMSNWVEAGLNVTNTKIVSGASKQVQTWDEHGILCRKYDDVTDSYDDEQLRIINKGLYFTNDSWLSAKVGIGDFYYYNPETGTYEESYGMIADTLVGNLILSEKVGIYNTSNSIVLDENGLTITTDGTSEGANNMALTLQRKEYNEDGEEVLTKYMYVDADGNLVLNGSIGIYAMGESSTTLANLCSDEWYSSKVGDTISTAITEYENTVQGKYDEVMSYIDEELEKYKELVGHYLEFGANGLVIGSITTDEDTGETEQGVFKTVIDSTKISFIETDDDGNDVTVASISGQLLHINNAIIDSSLIVGEFIFTPYGDDGGFAIAWGGG